MTILQGHIEKLEQSGDSTRPVTVTVNVQDNESFRMAIELAAAAKYPPGAAVTIRVEPVTP